MSGGAIRFLFDYVSPYAYLASTQIRAIGSRAGIAVVPVPVLFAGMLDATGARGPAEIAAKRAYMHRDVDRLARSLGVSVEPPATHPFNPLVALRITGCVADVAARWRLVEAIYRAAWAGSQRVDDPLAVARLASSVGLDGDALIQEATSPEAKARLRTATEEAIAAGVFGVPTSEVEGELFWGVDSLPLLERFLAGELRFDADRAARWQRVTPSATRK